MITKQTAALLFAFGFILVDKEGRQHTIDSISSTEYGAILFETDKGDTFTNREIGTDYWILKRPYSQLTKSIVVDGKEIVPIVELANVIAPDKGWKMKENACVSNNDIRFRYFDGGFEMYYYSHNHHVPNQQQLFQELYSLHFVDLPEGTYREME